MKDLLITFLSRGGSVIIGLAMQSLLAWKLGPEGRGEYALCLIFSSLASTICILSLDWAVNYHISAKQFSVNKIITFSIIAFLIITTLQITTLPLLTKIKIPFFTQLPNEVWMYSVIWSVSLTGFAFSTAIIAGMRNFYLLGKLTLLRIFLTFVIAFFLFEMASCDVKIPIIADTISNLLIIFIFGFLLVTKFNYRLDRPNFLLTKKIINYAVRFFGGSISMMANARIGTILLAFYVDDKKSLGYFALSMSFLAQLSTISDITARIIQPRIAESKDGRPELVSLCTRSISALVLVLGGFLTLTSTYWIPILFSSDFLPIIPIINILIPGIWLRVIGKVLFPYFNGMNYPEIVSISTFITLLSNIALLFILLPSYGLTGAALATTISYVLSTAYTVFKYLKMSGESISGLIIPKPDDRLVLFKHLTGK